MALDATDGGMHLVATEPHRSEMRFHKLLDSHASLGPKSSRLDGMAAAEGCLFLETRDGRVLCLASAGKE